MKNGQFSLMCNIQLYYIDHKFTHTNIYIYIVKFKKLFLLLWFKKRSLFLFTFIYYFLWKLNIIFPSEFNVDGLNLVFLTLLSVDNDIQLIHNNNVLSIRYTPYDNTDIKIWKNVRRAVAYISIYHKVL